MAENAGQSSQVLIPYFIEVVIYQFLAPNYCDQRGNDGAYLTIRPDNNLVPIPNEFQAVEHPPCQPMMYANPMMRMAGLA